MTEKSLFFSMNRLGKRRTRVPTETFHHLPKNKQECITIAALREFGKYDYPSVVLDAIVQDAGIPKGSLYQYFEDKKDLYAYLVQYAARDKLSYLMRYLQQESSDPSELLEALFYRSMQYTLKNPKTSGILYRNARERSDPELADIAEKLMRQARELVKEILSRSLREGYLRKDLDVELAAYLIAHLSIEFEDFLGDKYHFSYHEVLVKEMESLPIPPDELKECTELFIGFILSGLER